MKERIPPRTPTRVKRKKKRTRRWKYSRGTEREKHAACIRNCPLNEINQKKKNKKRREKNATLGDIRDDEEKSHLIIFINSPDE